MKTSERLAKRLERLQLDAVSEIRLLLKQHDEFEVEAEIEDGILFYDDEINEPQYIATVDHDGVIITNYDDKIGELKLEELPIDLLIEVVESLERSLKGAKQFLNI